MFLLSLILKPAALCWWAKKYYNNNVAKSLRIIDTEGLKIIIITLIATSTACQKSNHKQEAVKHISPVRVNHIRGQHQKCTCGKKITLPQYLNKYITWYGTAKLHFTTSIHKAEKLSLRWRECDHSQVLAGPGLPCCMQRR